MNVSDLFAYSLRAFSLRPLRLKKRTWIKTDRKLSTSALNLMALPYGTPRSDLDESVLHT
jgi:hypothetical protein